MTDMSKLSQLSFRELKEELINSKNSPVKELIIRKLMQKKYNEYKMRKQQKVQKISKIDEFPLTDEDFNNPLPAQPIAEFEQVDDDLNKFKSEIEKDYLNNNLMERMNSEIDIRVTKKKNNKKYPKKKEFIPPFTDDNTDKYAPFNDQTFNNNLYDFKNKYK